MSGQGGISVALSMGKTMHQADYGISIGQFRHDASAKYVGNSAEDTQ